MSFDKSRCNLYAKFIEDNSDLIAVNETYTKILHSFIILFPQLSEKALCSIRL